MTSRNPIKWPQASLVIAILLTLHLASPAHAQYEPWEFTALREALRQDVPDAALAVRALKQWRKDDLSRVWLKSLGTRATAELFDTFADCCGVADSPMGQDFARQKAKVFLTLMGHTTQDEQIQRSAGALTERMRALSLDERRQLQEFAQHTKGRIEKKQR